ncbi:kelch-like protein 7 [Drosophila takahashii]|uniref:kelch-like protein 7 n=1 Tax=Drosophila takahashii TaxID=29030 RepID=UPI003898FDA7
MSEIMETPDGETPDKETPDEEAPDEEVLVEQIPDEELPNEETLEEETPNEETSRGDLEELDLKVTTEDESTVATESSAESSVHFIHQLPCDSPFLLGAPFDLRVGNFDDVLHQLSNSGTDLTGRQIPQVSVQQMAKNLDPEETVGLALDELWSESMGPPRVFIPQQLLTMFKENVRPTLIVVVEEKQFHCHAMVLQVLSSFFRRPKFSTSHIFQLPSSMVSARSFVAMYRWALEPSEQMGPILLMQVFRTARFFGCQELVANCWIGIDEGSRVPDRALCIYICSRMMGLQLEEGLLSRLGSIFLQFVASKEFLVVAPGTVRRLLGLNSLAVNTELEVFLAAILWLNYKWPQRKHLALNMMQPIRFDLMPFMFLFTVVRGLEDGPPVMRMLVNAPAFRKRALSILNDIKGSRTRYQGRYGDNARTWIYDRRAPHHHGSKCRQMQFLNWDSFVRYLTWLQSAGSKHWLSLRTIDDPEVKCCPIERRR